MDSGRFAGCGRKRWPPICTVAVLVGLLAGCQSNAELLEVRLRDREDRLLELERDLAGLRKQLDVARSEKQRLQVQLAAASEGRLAEEQFAVVARVAGIEIPGLLLGWTRRPELGQSALQFVVIPQDGVGDTLKVTGSIRLELRNAPKESGTLIAIRELSDRQVEQSWHAGLLGSGIQLELPLPKEAESQLSGERPWLRVVFETADGRRFEAWAQTPDLDPLDDAA